MSQKGNTFRRGIHPPDKKELTKDLPVCVMPETSDYYVSMSAHIGAPATCIVAVGDVVKEGQLIAENKARLGSNVFSPVAGVVVGIEKRKTANGGKAETIHIKAEGEGKVTLPPIGEITKDSILRRIEEAGIVGLGGAGFPAHFKDKPRTPCDALLINGAECEPYLTCDDRLMVEYADKVAKDIKYLETAVGATKVVVGIEDNKPEAIEKMRAQGLDVVVLPKKYPQGAEKMLVYACLNRVVPAGGLPSDVGVVVHNVATAYAVYDAVENGEPLYKRIVTVSGKGVERPCNMWVKNGTLHEDILKYCGIKDETVALISGGPMMGHALEGMTASTTKAESGILALTDDEVDIFEPTHCIFCGSCARACPMSLMPMYIDFYAHARKTDEAIKYGALNCMECGSCAYVCPAERPIVQSVRLVKMKAREENKK